METFGPDREQSMLNHPSNYNNNNNPIGNNMTENTSPWAEYLIEDEEEDLEYEEHTQEEYEQFEIDELLADEARYLAEYEKAAAKRAEFEAFKASGKFTDEHIKPEITVDWDTLSEHEKKIYTIKFRIALAKWTEDLENAKRTLAEAPTKLAYWEALVADLKATGPVFMTTHPCV